MAMGVVGSFWVVFPEAGALLENFKVLGPVPFGIVEVMGRLKCDFFGEFDHRLFHEKLTLSILGWVVIDP
jgi:hypothetical protein